MNEGPSHHSDVTSDAQFLASASPDEIETAINHVAVAAFHANLGEEDFMALNCDGLIAFRFRYGLSQRDMNLAWCELQRRSIAQYEARGARFRDLSL